MALRVAQTGSKPEKTEEELAHIHAEKTQAESDLAEAGSVKKDVEKKTEEILAGNKILQAEALELIEKKNNAGEELVKATNDLTNFKIKADAEKKEIMQAVEAVKIQHSAILEDISNILLAKSNHEKGLSELTGKVSNIELDIKNKQVALDEAEKCLTILLGRIQELDLEIATKTNAVKKAESLSEKMTSHITRVQESIAELERNYLSLTNKIKEKVAELSKLQNEVTENEKLVAEAKESQTKIKADCDERLKIIANADLKLSERVEIAERMVEDGKAKGHLNQKFKL